MRTFAQQKSPSVLNTTKVSLSLATWRGVSASRSFSVVHSPRSSQRDTSSLGVSGLHKWNTPVNSKGLRVLQGVYCPRAIRLNNLAGALRSPSFS